MEVVTAFGLLETKLEGNVFSSWAKWLTGAGVLVTGVNGLFWSKLNKPDIVEAGVVVKTFGAAPNKEEAVEVVLEVGLC